MSSLKEKRVTHPQNSGPQDTSTLKITSWNADKTMSTSLEHMFAIVNKDFKTSHVITVLDYGQEIYLNNSSILQDNGFYISKFFD